MKIEATKEARKHTRDTGRQYEVNFTGIICSELKCSIQKNGAYYCTFEIICFKQANNYPRKIKCFGMSEGSSHELQKYIKKGYPVNMLGDCRENRIDRNGDHKSPTNLYYVPRYLYISYPENGTIKTDSEIDGVYIDLSEELERNTNISPNKRAEKAKEFIEQQLAAQVKEENIKKEKEQKNKIKEKSTKENKV